MRIPSEENVPRKLKQAFPNFIVATVGEMGWAGISNGELFIVRWNKLQYLLPLVPRIPQALTDIQPRQIANIS